MIKKVSDLGLIEFYNSHDQMFYKENKSEEIETEISVTYDANNNFKSVQLNAFLNDLKIKNIKEVEQKYNKLINNILEMKKVHLELIKDEND